LPQLLGTLTENNSEYVILNSAIIEVQAPGFSYGKNRKIVPSHKVRGARRPYFKPPALAVGSIQNDVFRMTYSSDQKGPQVLIEQMQGFLASQKLGSPRDKIKAALTYFKNQQPLMKYAEHLSQFLPMGAGVTEAACKTIVKQRLCCSGMKWKEAGAAVVLSLRTLSHSCGRA